FDLHGIVGIRFKNPSDIDIKYISNLLSPFKSNLKREPDITVIFKENWELGELTYLGLNNAAFNEHGFYILSSGRTPLKVKIPFEQIGNKCEIVCEQGIIGIPLLNYIISLTFLKKNYLPIHASAFSYNKSNSMMIGWSKGGKTEALFSFIQNGAEFIGDETVFLSTSGKKIFGMPVPVSIWEWQFKEIKELIPRLSMQQRILFNGIHCYEFIYKTLKKIGLKKNAIVRLLGDALPSLSNQLNIRVAPDKIFKDKVSWDKHTLHRVILAVSHSNNETSIKEYDAESICSRMISSNLYEFEPFYSYYTKFKFAFPGVKNDFLENVPKLYEELIPQAISDIKTYKLAHPYPISFNKLFHVMEPVLNGKKDLDNKQGQT
ncbi:MAG: hypothetical protein PVF17_08980, partial [Ignavibacteria bacterium]